MIKAVVLLVIVVLLLVFTMQNMEHAVVYVVTGQPIRIPLILLIAISFVLGYAFALLTFVLGIARRKKGKEKMLDSRKNVVPSRVMK